MKEHIILAAETLLKSPLLGAAFIGSALFVLAALLSSEVKTGWKAIMLLTYSGLIGLITYQTMEEAGEEKTQSLLLMECASEHYDTQKRIKDFYNETDRTMTILEAKNIEMEELYCTAENIQEQKH